MASRSLRALVAALLLSGLASTLLMAVAVSSPTSSVAPSHSSVTLQGACYPMERSVDIFLFCVRSSGLSTRCCDRVVEAAASGGLICLCQIAATPSMAISGYSAVDLLAWYDECGGTAPVDAHLLAKCGATAMSSHIESSARSLPALHSSADKTKKEGDIESENAMHASNSAEQTIPSSPDLVNEKSADQNQYSKKVTIMINVQTWHIVVGVVVAVVLLVYGALWVVVRFAAPSPTRDKAKVVLDTITPFLPALLKAALKETEKAALKAAFLPALLKAALKQHVKQH